MFLSFPAARKAKQSTAVPAQRILGLLMRLFDIIQ